MVFSILILYNLPVGPEFIGEVIPEKYNDHNCRKGHIMADDLG